VVRRPVGALLVQVLVGAFDQVLDGVIGLELRQPNGDRTRFGAVAERGVDLRQALADVVLAQASNHTHELITPDPHDQVVWPELGLQRPGDLA